MWRAFINSSCGCSTIPYVIQWCIDWVSYPFPPNLQNTINPKTNKARDLHFWHNIHHLSPVMCHMSRVTCHLSRVTCGIFYIYLYIYIYFLNQFWSLLVEGLLSTGPTPVLKMECKLMAGTSPHTGMPGWPPGRKLLWAVCVNTLFWICGI